MIRRNRFSVVLGLATLAACAQSPRPAFRPVPQASSGITSAVTASSWLGSAPEQVAVFEVDGAEYAVRAAPHWGFLALSLELVNRGEQTATADPTALRLYDANRFEMPLVAPDVVATSIGGQYVPEGTYAPIVIIKEDNEDQPTQPSPPTPRSVTLTTTDGDRVTVRTGGSFSPGGGSFSPTVVPKADDSFADGFEKGQAAAAQYAAEQAIEERRDALEAADRAYREGLVGSVELLPGTARRGRLFYELPPEGPVDVTVRLPDGRELRFEYGLPPETEQSVTP